MENYLTQWETIHKKHVCKTYKYAIDLFLKTTAFDPLKPTYQSIINYITIRRELGDSIYLLLNMVSSIKFYYKCLLELGIIAHHPCPKLVLKDHIDRSIAFDTLYTKEELEAFVKRSKNTLFSLRNKVIRQLLVYQALTPEEITNLKITDIDLEKATILLSNRKLSLKPIQMIDLYRYINENRPKFITQNSGSVLLLSRTGRSLIKEHINTITNKGYDKKIKPRVIRKSVIYQLLQQGENLRSVQLFAGHQSILSTERYQNSHIEQLRGQLQLHHPLNDLK